MRNVEAEIAFILEGDDPSESVVNRLKGVLDNLHDEVDDTREELDKAYSTIEAVSKALGES